MIKYVLNEETIEISKYDYWKAKKDFENYYCNLNDYNPKRIATFTTKETALEFWKKHGYENENLFEQKGNYYLGKIYYIIEEEYEVDEDGEEEFQMEYGWIEENFPRFQDEDEDEDENEGDKE